VWWRLIHPWSCGVCSSFWRRLGIEPPPQRDVAVAALVDAGILRVEPTRFGPASTMDYVLLTGDDADGSSDGPDLFAGLDILLVEFWLAVHEEAVAREIAGSPVDGWVVNSAPSAVPYLLCLADGMGAARLLDEVGQRDKSAE